MDRLRTVWNGWRLSAGRLLEPFRGPVADRSGWLESLCSRLRGRMETVWSQFEGRLWHLAAGDSLLTFYGPPEDRLESVRGPVTDSRMSKYGHSGTVGEFLQAVYEPSGASLRRLVTDRPGRLENPYPQSDD